MTDFPQNRSAVMDAAPAGVLSTVGPASPVGMFHALARINANAGAVWPSASLAIYTSVLVPDPVTVYQMAIEVTTQAGNVDVGIYDENLSRLVSSGSTAVAAAGLQAFNITDTVLTPGLYYLAMACDSATAAFRRGNPASGNTRVCGVAQQATAIPLPATATFATITQSYIPVITAYLSSVTP